MFLFCLLTTLYTAYREDNMIKVSIIVPVYNAEGYLRDCLSSLVTQDNDSFEIICINDGSTDKSIDILNEFSSKYTNIIVLHNEINRGLSFSRNRGISASRGEYLLFVDSDDWLTDKNVVTILYNKANDKGLDLLRFNLNTDQDVMEREIYEAGKKLFSYLICNDIYKWESVRNFVRRDFLYDKKIFFDEEIYGCEDILFSTKCIWNVEKAGEIPNVFYYYNRHEGSITRSSVTSKNVEGLLRVINAIYTLFAESINDEHKYYLINLLNKLIEMCGTILFRLDSSLNYKKWSTEIVSLYENIFREGNLIHNYVVHENWDRVLNSDNVYLYGAGKACEELLYKTNHRVKYAGVIVTKKDENQLFFHEINMYEVDDKNIDKQGLIVICITGKERQEEVKRKLSFFGFNNILSVAKE